MMANPSSQWDFVPVYGVWLNPMTRTASPGEVSFSLSARITRVDGREIYPDGALLKATIGDQAQQDAEVRSIVRAAWRAADEAALGEAFDGTAWDARWDTVVVPAAIFVRFPAADDPDIVQTGWTVTVSEALQSGGGKKYSIQPLLSQLDNPIPGINLGTIEVPPGSPTVPAPMYAKGVAGGVASLDETAKIPLEQIPDDIGGGVSSWDDLEDKPAVIAAGATAAAARDAIGAQPAGSYATAAQGAKADSAVQPAGLTKSAVGLGAVDNTSDADKPVSTAQAAAITAAINSLVSGAPGTLDTLAEIAAALGGDPNLATTITNALAARVRTDTAAQGLTGTQKANARTNIDATLLVVDPGSTSGLADGTLIAYTS
jgi:hypothetical protein